MNLMRSLSFLNMWQLIHGLQKILYLLIFPNQLVFLSNKWVSLLVGFLILAVPGVVFAPMFGLLTVGFGVLGAVNGATLAARRSMKRRRAILEIGEQED